MLNRRKHTIEQMNVYHNNTFSKSIYLRKHSTDCNKYEVSTFKYWTEDDKTKQSSHVFWYDDEILAITTFELLKKGIKK